MSMIKTTKVLNKNERSLDYTIDYSISIKSHSIYYLLTKFPYHLVFGNEATTEE
jgi:hypothetical protein